MAVVKSIALINYFNSNSFYLKLTLFTKLSNKIFKSKT